LHFASQPWDGALEAAAFEGLADDVLNAAAHAAMKARAKAKRKPRREDGAKSKPIEDRRLHRQELSRRSL